MKNLIINRYTVWTVPNILVFLRILSVPVYMTLVILSAKDGYPDWYSYVAVGVMVFAASTDLFDGMIARRFPAGSKIGKHVVKHDQGTYVGQLIDPVADKTMHIGAILALVIAGYLHYAFIISLVVRETVMLVCGFVLRDKVNVKSNMLGKVASAILSIGIIMCFFHNFFRTLWGEYGIDWIVVTIGLVLNIAAALGYLVYVRKQLKENKTKKENKEIEG